MRVSVSASRSTVPSGVTYVKPRPRRWRRMPAMVSLTYLSPAACADSTCSSFPNMASLPVSEGVSGSLRGSPFGNPDVRAERDGTVRQSFGLRFSPHGVQDTKHIPLQLCVLFALLPSCPPVLTH